MTVVERFKQESMYGLSNKKSGRCRDVAVSTGSTVYFFLAVNTVFDTYPSFGLVHRQNSYRNHGKGAGGVPLPPLFSGWLESIQFMLLTLTDFSLPSLPITTIT